jgi:hypothetical protein
MKTHNSERQAVLKGKRDEAEEEARARTATASERPAKRRAVQAEEAKHSSRRTRTAPRRAKPKAAPGDRSSIEEEIVSQEAPLSTSDDVPAVNIGETAEHLERERLRQEDLHSRTGTRETEIDARSKAFLAILISNAASNRYLRRSDE